MLRCIEDSIKAILGSDMKIKDSPSSSPEPSSSSGLTAREPLMLVKVTQKEGQGHAKRKLESDSESDTEEYTVNGEKNMHTGYAMREGERQNVSKVIKTLRSGLCKGSTTSIYGFITDPGA